MVLSFCLRSRKHIFKLSEREVTGMSKRDEQDTKEVKNRRAASDKSYQDQSVTKDEWRQMCGHEKKWCEYQDVAGMNRLQALGYIKGMPTFEPM